MITLSLLPLSSQADYPSGDLLYSDDIIPNAEFIWTVEQLSASGDYAYAVDYNYLDQIFLAEGQTIKLVVTEDPDTANDTWYDLFVNNVKVNNPENTSIGTFAGYSPYGQFITPVKYDNGSVYDLYTQLYEEFEDAGAFIDAHFLYHYSDMISEYSYSINMRFELTDNIFKLVYSIGLDDYFIDPTDDDESIEKISIEAVSAIDINSGIIQEYRTIIDYEIYEKVAGNVTTDEEGHYYLQILAEGYDPDPSSFSILFSILGLSIFGVIVYTIRRR